MNSLICLYPLPHSVQWTRPLLWDLKQAALRINFHSIFYFVVCHLLAISVHVSVSVLPLTFPHHLRADSRLHICSLLCPMKPYGFVPCAAHFLEWQPTLNPLAMWHSLGKGFKFLATDTSALAICLKYFSSFPVNHHTSHCASNAPATPWHIMTLRLP